MAGRHSQPQSSKKPVIIIAIIVAVVIIAAVVAGIFFFGGKGGDKTPESTAATVIAEETTVAVDTTAAEEDTTASDNTDTTAATTQPSTETVTEAPTEAPTEATQEATKEKVEVPVDDDSDTAFFNATFVPTGEVIDTYTGKKSTLREVFGSNYANGSAVTFKDDGTFTDDFNIASSSGAYAVQKESIIATYSNDKNMEITVTGWEDGVPTSFYIVYGGYEVYFQ